MTIYNFKERIANSFKKMQDERLKSLEKFIIGKTYLVLSLKSDPIIEQEIKILDKNYRNDRIYVLFKNLGNINNVNMWVDPTKFEIVREVEEPKQHVKWYSKGKFAQEEDWTNESKDGYVNLSYELKDLIGFNKLSDMNKMELLNELLKVVSIFINYRNTGRRIEVLAKKSNTLFGIYSNEKVYNIEIISHFTEVDGKINFYGKELDDDYKYYKVDLIRCAENPEEYPIYVKNYKRLHTSEDPWGEEDWAIESLNESKKDDEEALRIIEDIKNNFNIYKLYFNKNRDEYSYQNNNDYPFTTYFLKKNNLDVFNNFLKFSYQFAHTFVNHDTEVFLKVSGNIKRDLWNFFTEKWENRDRLKKELKRIEKKKKKQRWQKLKDVDPYMEEDWND